MNTDKIYAESIVNEYSIKDDSKVIALKKLDRKATIFVYTFGLIAALIAGLGICLSMKVIGNHMILGIIGFVLMGLNYPIYKRLLERGKQKYAFEIVELAK